MDYRSMPLMLALLLGSVAATARAEQGESVGQRPASNAAADWPQFLGPSRDLHYHGRDLVSRWGAEGPPVRFKLKVGSGHAGPVVMNARLIVFHRVGDEESVECYQSISGKKLWQYRYPTSYVDDFGMDEGPRATPTLLRTRKGGLLYTYGAQGVLHCLDFGTGKVRWRIDAAKAYGAGKGFFGRACSPLIVDGVLVMNIGGKNGNGIAGFDAITGKRLWSATDDEAGYASPSSMKLGGKTYALFHTREGLRVVEPQTGKLIYSKTWRATMHASVNAATPLAFASIGSDAPRGAVDVFLSSSYGTGAGVLRFSPQSPATPKLLWKRDGVLSNHYATSVFHEGYLYGFDGRQEQGQRLRCVRATDGKVMWTHDDIRAGTVLIGGGKLVVLSERGRLVIAPATPDGFKPTAESQVLGFDTRAYPALAQGRLYARDKRQLVCVDLRWR